MSNNVEENFYIEGAAPTGRCGHTTDYHQDDLLLPGNVTCWRPSWNETGRCIWHAKTDKKNDHNLWETRTNNPERLDGANLRNVDFQEKLSFNNCTLVGADFCDSSISVVSFESANLRKANAQNTEFWSVDFADANLEWVKFNNANITANLNGARISHANLEGSIISECSLKNAKLSHTNLEDADLRSCNCQGATFQSANLRNAGLVKTNLNRVDLSNSTLEKANLEDASLVQSDLRNANLKGARLYQTYFSDTRINSRTFFGKECIYEDPNFEPQIWIWDAEPLEAAVWTYRRLADLHEQYALTESARRFHVRKQESRRKYKRENGDYGEWLLLELSRWFTTHNESPLQVVKASLGLITVWTGLYLLLGDIIMPQTSTDARFVGLNVFPIESLPNPLAEIAVSLYFSVVTFTTLGYGDLQPAPGIAQALATIESFAGALLMSLLVFVLGRRTTW